MWKSGLKGPTHPVRAGIALAAGLGFTIAALAVVLSRSPPAVTRSELPLTNISELRVRELDLRICQPGEAMPRGTTAVRVVMAAVAGPPVSIEALSGRRVLTRGAKAAGWTAGSVTVPVARVSRAWRQATVCVNVAESYEPVVIAVAPTAPAVAAVARRGPLPPVEPGLAATYRESPLPGRLIVEYLRPGDSSWWSLVLSVARRMGLGHAAGGTWLALLAALLMAAVAVAASRAILEELA